MSWFLLTFTVVTAATHTAIAYDLGWRISLHHLDATERTHP